MIFLFNNLLLSVENKSEFSEKKRRTINSKGLRFYLPLSWWTLFLTMTSSRRTKSPRGLGFGAALFMEQFFLLVAHCHVVIFSVKGQLKLLFLFFKSFGCFYHMWKWTTNLNVVTCNGLYIKYILVSLRKPISVNEAMWDSFFVMLIMFSVRFGQQNKFKTIIWRTTNRNPQISIRKP